MAQATFEEISASDFFYRNRDLAGFTNPSRAIFAAVRELVENSLDAAESLKIPPDIYVRLSFEGGVSKETQVYKLRVEDNGSGITPRHIPSAFGQVLYGSKYKLKQQRGTFGLGGKMAVLYGQIMTHQPAYVVSSTGASKIYSFKLMIDIQRNRPIIIDRKVLINKEKWRGTIVEFSLEGDYLRAMPKIIEYFKQTAMVNPYANLTFVDPKGRLYKFTRATTEMPGPPKETLPHPYGVDVELLQRLIQITPYKNMLEFLRHHFHRVGEITAQKFLIFSDLVTASCPEHGALSPDQINWVEGKPTCSRCGKEAKLSSSKNPKRLSHEEIVRLMQNLKKFKEFLPPDASCLSPLSEDLLKAGIMKELKPEYLVVHQRKPSTYAGHPFIVEMGIAYGGEVPKRGNFVIYRFANRIPLLYDEASDVSFRVINSMNWRRYKVSPDMPIAIVVHICSTKVPYKTVGKEFIADRPEVKREVANALREVGRQLQHFLTRREHVDKERKRLGIFAKYLPKIAQFSSDLAGKEKLPDIEKLLKSVQKFGAEET
ncbi:MAG TPA: DNA topoisomerase VI subunit B [Candidatus Bathyarchaeia archaeon]|nr:DNA topoisomerase VI subunit B [Candidatus Bathyarchaeia archaeon]